MLARPDENKAYRGALNIVSIYVPGDPKLHLNYAVNKTSHSAGHRVFVSQKVLLESVPWDWF